MALDIELWKRIKTLNPNRIRYEKYPPVETLPGYWIVYLTVKDRETGGDFEEGYRVNIGEPQDNKRDHLRIANAWNELIGDLP